MSNQMTNQLEGERELTQPEELNHKQSLTINVDTPEGLDLLENLYGLTSEDQHYETIFFLDFYGNMFYYSKMMDDSQRNYYLSNGMKSIGFADIDYHYYLELCFQAQILAEEELLLDKCINSLEENKCPLLEDLEIETEEQYSPCELSELYYQKILNKIGASISILKYWISENNEASIILFKKWFINYFAEKYDENYYYKYNWQSCFCKKIMNITLTHLKEDYSIHETGGSYEFFFEKMIFLRELAAQPFEIELFELVEGNFELFIDED